MTCRVLWPHEVARHRRAERRARAMLKHGDRLYVNVCGGRGVTVTFVGWNDQMPGYIVTKTLDGDEIHPSNIRKVNGQAVSFGDLRSVPLAKSRPTDTSGGAK